ncbi:SDR family oxidoreductase [Allobranchiibius huperziae]|uniref:Uncharacterized protein YbjT (DUF2867 family) n=1 Tax=Allobranchiibius huperziae TaxID=1874116 RepID=A0A853DG15_9MICO|nr:SDR family oxidoreductase [Allobranchiibius huperziae]NYJ73630.1 uncharacterized protein YbjT (DUF2867 family) [Allobranchiibius huperziae]
MGTAPIAVTGVTGYVGGRVAASLADAGVPQILLARDVGRVPRLPDAQSRAVDYSDGDGARRALDGVEVLLMVSAAESADRLDQHRTFVDAAAAAGVRHIVYTSFQGAAPDAAFTLSRTHAATEQHIQDSGMSWTFLRDSFYIDFLSSLPGDDGVIRGPAGDGRVAAVTRDDVARVAARILQAPEAHARRTYDLTGPEALTLAEVADIVGRATGRAVSFHDETIDEAYESRKKWPAPQWQYDAWVSTYTAIASGELAALSTAVQDITGSAPTSLRDYLAGQSQA